MKGEREVLMRRLATVSYGRRLGLSDLTPQENFVLYGADSLPHGCDAVVEAVYRGRPDPVHGMVANLTEVKAVLERVLQPLRASFLEAGAPPLANSLFAAGQPTAENLVHWLWQQLPPTLGPGTLSRLHWRESSRLQVVLSPSAMRLTRSYEFSAAHRLHAPALSAPENHELYGQCNNPRGHGHNYGLEVTLEGEADARHGLLIPRELLDRVVEEEVFARFDHRHLNEDCAEFNDLVPTSENLALIIFGHLQRRLEREGYCLARVGLHETAKNYFEVEA